MSEQLLSFEDIMQFMREGAREWQEIRRKTEESATEFGRRMKEADRRGRELDKRIEKTRKQVGELTSLSTSFEIRSFFPTFHSVSFRLLFNFRNKSRNGAERNDGVQELVDGLANSPAA